MAPVFHLYAQTLPAVTQFDQYLPGELNERALKSLIEDDLSSASIYIERAYRLNPLSPDINQNRELIRSLNADKTTYQVSQPASSTNIVREVDAESMQPLWPRK